MQEGTLALMQLAKTVAVLERVRAARIPYISVMSDPTTGGVFASYAVLGDINLAEPNALIGFAGARVAAGTIAQELPPGFQRSEFLFEHGFIDRVVHRRALRGEIAGLLRFMRPPELSVDTRPRRDQPARLAHLRRGDRGRRGGGCASVSVGGAMGNVVTGGAGLATPSPAAAAPDADDAIHDRRSKRRRMDGRHAVATPRCRGPSRPRSPPRSKIDG